MSVRSYPLESILPMALQLELGTSNALTGDCGSRKSLTYLYTIARSLLGLSEASPRHFLVAIPNNDTAKDLITKLYEMMAQIDPSKNHKRSHLYNIRAVNTDEKYRGKRVMDSLITLRGEAEKTSFTRSVLFISHATYGSITEPDMFKGWGIYHDEVQSFYRMLAISFGDPKAKNAAKSVMFDDVFEVIDTSNEMHPKYGIRESFLMAAHHNDKNTNLRKVHHLWKTGRYDMYMVRDTSTNDEERIVTMMLCMNEKYYFHDTVLVGARLGDMLAGKYLAERGLLKKPIEMPSFNSNHLSANIIGRYVSLNDNSTSRRINYADDATYVFNTITAHIGDAEHMVWKNSDVSLSEVGYDSSAEYEEMMHNCWGSNDFDEYTIGAFLSSMNPHPAVQSVLQGVYGFDDASLYFNLTAMTAYQCLMRGAIRRDGEPESYQIYTYDYKLAATLKEHFFPNMQLEKLGDLQYRQVSKGGRPRKEVTIAPNDSIKAARIRKNLPEIAGQLGLSKLDCVRLQNASTEKLMQHPIWHQVTTKGVLPKTKNVRNGNEN